MDPDLGSKKFFLESWILDLGSRPWIQEVFPRILDLGSWIQISCYGSIAFINVCKHHLKNHSKNAPKKKVPKYAKNTVHTSKKCKNVGFFWGGYHIHGLGFHPYIQQKNLGQLVTVHFSFLIDCFFNAWQATKKNSLQNPEISVGGKKKIFSGSSFHSAWNPKKQPVLS